MFDRENISIQLDDACESILNPSVNGSSCAQNMQETDTAMKPIPGIFREVGWIN
jgi:hypothetical protein